MIETRVWKSRPYLGFLHRNSNSNNPKSSVVRDKLRIVDMLTPAFVLAAAHNKASKVVLINATSRIAMPSDNTRNILTVTVGPCDTGMN